MRAPTWGLLYWPAWLFVTGFTFLAGEIPALITNAANTLSDFSWYEMGINAHINPRHPAWEISLIAWLVFVVIITAHIWFRAPG